MSEHYNEMLEKLSLSLKDIKLIFETTDYFKEIRTLVPNNFLLVPGIGAQGGNLHDVCKYGMNQNIGLLINSSRGIIYASDQQDFAKAAAKEAYHLQQQMQTILNHNS